jgi:Bacterial membrane protein YfhO
MERTPENEWIPGVTACIVVGLLLGGLLVGYEPVGGDPDRIFRPIKAELAESLRRGRVPYWSDRLGLGVPLVAESHVAAYYPPNWVLYRVLGVSTAYRISMWLHFVALAAATIAYARQIGISRWGAALAGVAFPFCGFLTIQSSHEWAYQTLAYLPLCLLAADGYAKSGRWGWLGVLALLWGMQITIGHFQVQMWTGVLAFVTGGWRIFADRRPVSRLLGLALALVWGAAIAAVQLSPTWELAQLVGQTKRTFAELAYYSYPPGHWAELAAPALFRRLIGGAEAPYWFTQQTTGFEACLFIGTIPLILACVGMVGGDRLLIPWRVIAPLSFALATMPRWWPQGYAWLLMAPGLGYFRCPARYTAVTSFALALLAGGGLDRAATARRFRAGLALAIALGLAALAWSVMWVIGHPDLNAALGGDAGLSARLGLAALTWLAGFLVIVRWRRKRSNQAWAVVLLTAVEMGSFFFVGGTTHWGWSVALPDQSPVLKLLTSERGVIRVGGSLDNLPLLARLATATPYIGFPLLPPNTLLKAAQDPRNVDNPSVTRWFRRYGVTHLVSDSARLDSLGEVLYRGLDPALDQLVYQSPGAPARRTWRVVRLAGMFPEARIAQRAMTAPNYATLVNELSSRDAMDEAWFLPDEGPSEPTLPRASSSRVVRWDGMSGDVEHSGVCDLILMRAYYPGWVVKVGDEPERAVARADGGLIAVRLNGAGVSRVALRFRPNGFGIAVAVSSIAVVVAVGFVVSTFGRQRLLKGRESP